MKKFLVGLVIFFSRTCFAQCPFTVSLTSTTVCPGATLTAATVNVPDKIVWYANGSVVSTASAVSAVNPDAITVAGMSGVDGTGANQLNQPGGIFLDAAGNLYIADETNNRVQKWAPGASSGVTVAGGNGAGAAANQLSSPAAVFVDGAGNIYVCDYINNRVQKWAPGASSGVTVAGGNGRGAAANQLALPCSVFLDAAGNIYIADTYNFRVQKWAPGASSGMTVAGGNGNGAAANQLSYVYDLFVDAAGDIYVADLYNNRAQKWAPGASSGVTVAGGNGAGAAANQLNEPQAIWVDGNGDVFVADGGNGRIQEWAPGATSGMTVAGGNGDGPAANQLEDPVGVALDANGDIYVSDVDLSRVQEFKVQSSINNTYIAATPGTYTAVVTNAAGCTSTSNAVVIQGLLTPAVSISASGNPAHSCTLVSFTATATGAGSAPMYQWLVNGTNVGTNTPVFQNGGLMNGDVISCVLTATDVCSTPSPPPVTSNAIAMTVTALPAVTMITKGGYCSGDTLAITAADSLGQIIWMNNGVTVSTQQAAEVRARSMIDTMEQAAGAGNYTATVTTSGGCTINAGPIAITPSVNPAVTVGASATEVCSNIPITFTAMPVNGGAAPVYQWLVNGVGAGTNSATFTSNSLTGSSTINCLMTSNAVCSGSSPAVSNAVMVQVDPLLTPAVSINASAISLCTGGAVNFTALPVNGGGDPVYQWVVNGVVEGTNSPVFTSSSLADGDVIGCTLTGSAQCVTAATAQSNTIQVQVSPVVTPVVNVGVSADPVCSGTQVTFSATVTGEVGNPGFQWQVNGIPVGVDSPGYSTAGLANGDRVYCQVSSSNACSQVVGDSVVMTVNPTPVIPPDQVFADQSGGVVLTPQVSGDVIGYSWSPATGLSADTIADPLATPAASTVYTLSVVAADGCEASGEIKVNVYRTISIPNAFTPNGDGKNDIFYVLGGMAGSQIKDFSVFDRWGQRVFRAEGVLPGDPANGWNGTYGGAPAPAGVYVYIVTIALAGGERQVYKGTVMLVR
jgi:gliding motility-associated-like protein